MFLAVLASLAFANLPSRNFDQLREAHAMKSHPWIRAAALSVLAFAAAPNTARAQPLQPRPATEVRLSGEPTLAVGRLDGPTEYLFADINAGALLADGSMVVSDGQLFRVQRFSAEGEHLWSRGSEGEGPGEFEYVQIAEGCANAESIIVYDIWTTRVYVYDGEGNLVDEYRLLYNDHGSSLPQPARQAPSRRVPCSQAT